MESAEKIAETLNNYRAELSERDNEIQYLNIQLNDVKDNLYSLEEELEESKSSYYELQNKMSIYEDILSGLNINLENVSLGELEEIKNKIGVQ